MDQQVQTTSQLTFGDARRIIIETIMHLRSGEMNAATGMAIAANMKVLNDSVQTEINATKLALATEGRTHNFCKVVSMGQRYIGSVAD